MSPEPLGKSTPQQTLREHTDLVEQAVINLCSALSKDLEERLPLDFTTMLRHCAFFHDLGKIASGFQRVLSATANQPETPWRYRHEALSAAILLATELTDASSQMLFAVLTHHRTIDNDELASICGRNQLREDFEAGAEEKWKRKVEEMLAFWPWVVKYVADAEKSARIPPIPVSLPTTPDLLPNLYDAVTLLEATLISVRDLTPENLPWFLSRGLLMAGDHLASAGMSGPLTKLDGSSIKPAEGFQEDLRDVIGHALLEAPTGSGKTEAALHWALANRRKGERIFYVLPYQASINKMTERLEALFGRDEVGFVHHRATFQEFTRHFDGSDYTKASKQAKKRQDETKQFYRPVKVLTPYQMLKLMFGCRFFEIGLAELLGGLVIFDEIHAYDPHIAALIEIMVARLQTLGVRFLFMTATFPDFLKTRLQDSLGVCQMVTVQPDDPRANVLLNSARHRLHLHNCFLEDMVEAIISDVEVSKKTLVVCNRVGQAQELYGRIVQDKRLQGRQIALLHSRFTSGDRIRKERNLTAFPDDPDPLRQQIPVADLLITTQVIEVSLNLSFDTLYTEIAPVDALLQRFGRVNRAYQHGCAVPVHVATRVKEESVRYIYNLERIKLTLAVAKDGVDLFATEEQNWVQQTYADGYLANEQKRYEEAKSAFTKVVQNLRPGYNGNDEDFYELFDNYSVVPVRFKLLYQQAIQEKRFFHATEYVVSLSASTFRAMQQAENDTAMYDKENHVWYMKRRYDVTLGLLNEPETAKSYLQEQLDEQFR